MTLQRKFVVIVGLLGLAVVVCLGTALWSFTLLQREVSRPFADVSRALAGLSVIKRALGEERRLLNSVAPGRAERSRLEALAAQVAVGLSDLESREAALISTGVSALRTLRENLGALSGLAERWTEGVATAEDLDRARASADQALEIVERIERRVFADADMAVAYGRDLQRRLLTVVALALLGATLVGVLGVLLLRRWVERPVRDLRSAARRIASGDFAHRIDVPEGARDELALLSAEVNHMAGMVRTMQEERIRQELLAAMGGLVRRLAHNLRNPLAGIRSLAELTRSDLPAGSDLRENQDRIVVTIDRFERWLKDLLSATSPLQIRPEALPVRPWLEGVIAAHEPMARTRDVSLRLVADSGPETAPYDPMHLEQAIVAILTNAIEASPPGGVVRVGLASVNGATWEVRIEDQGPGVPAELGDKIFAAHFTTKATGTGIGLAVAQQVVRGHGGRITVESASGALGTPRGAGRSGGAGGRGAAFVVRLPLNVAPAPPLAGSGNEERLHCGRDPGH